MAIPETLNMEFIDAQYTTWKRDPASVPPDWQRFFEGFEVGLTGAGTVERACREEDLLKQARVEALKNRYRDLGHLLSCLDPLSACPTRHPYLDLEAFGLGPGDLDTPFFTRMFPGRENVPLKEIVSSLKETYCRSIGVEYMHLQDPKERGWLQDRMEPVRNVPAVDADTRIRILQKLIESASFEAFLNKKYVGVTRFSLEGGDGVIPMLNAMVQRASESGCEEIILGMAHRGRLNVQAHILGKPLTAIFAEFEHCYDPDDLVGSGDVKYHNGFLSDVPAAGEKKIRILLANNPSHLEAVDPVVEGIARARQELLQDESRNRVMPVLIHGDAAFAGQGVVAEVLNLSQLSGYRTGGTIHIVINNQIGYTTLPEDARSTRYSTDVAKMLMVPIFHVHGENPEALVHVMRLAVDYRMTFKKDVVLDVVCYRRYGHNEGDEPYFTQPLMYERIRQRPTLDTLYEARLLEENVLQPNSMEPFKNEVLKNLSAAFEEIHGSACLFPQDTFYGNWKGYSPKIEKDPFPTGVESGLIQALSKKLTEIPEGFKAHRKIEAMLKKRAETVATGQGIDWGTAEALAFGTLLAEGVPIRLSGQDCGRGTFSQRHAIIFDTQSGESYTPLSHVAPDQAPFSVLNSLLAEYSVLGFEYGFSMVRPEALTIWEAQFGDFSNNAQSIIDLFIASGESKWQRLCGLVMLLPHGLEGLGPEHSSARMERYLQLCAQENMQVVNLTTPAQYFHVFRRQMRRNTRKPLIVMTPKSLLRHPQALSDLKSLTTKAFSPVLDDEAAASSAKAVLMCSGKVYYDLLAARKAQNASHTAIVRVEQLYPFPENELLRLFKKYKKAVRWAWVQEEPENMGAWSFVHPRLSAILGRSPDHVTRPASPSPATGFPAIYRQQHQTLLAEAFSQRT